MQSVLMPRLPTPRRTIRRRTSIKASLCKARVVTPKLWTLSKPRKKSLPNAPAPFLLAAVSLLALGRPNEALHAASDACYRAPKLPQANYVYGQAWLALNNPARAERAFADAINNAPTWADAWVNYGIARYRQGAIEDAKKAMREALARQPGHAGATANLGAFMRVSAETPALTVWKPTDPAIALGLAVEFLMKRPVFAKLPFGEWADILLGQINRGHFFFAVDERRRVHGMFGWALTQEALAEEWVEGRMELRNEDCREGDCVIANVLAADSADANRALADEGRKVLAGKRLFYAKRYYANGRTRPLRMPGKVLGRYFAGSRR
jgi:hemolysin-activating ACP:hemolysin acyltransferase